MKKLIIASMVTGLLTGCGGSNSTNTAEEVIEDVEDVVQEIEQEVEEVMTPISNVGSTKGIKITTENADEIIEFMKAYETYLSNPLANTTTTAMKTRSMQHHSTPCTISGTVGLAFETTGDVTTEQNVFTKMLFNQCLNAEIVIANYDNVPETLTDGVITFDSTSYNSYSSFDHIIYGDIENSFGAEYMNMKLDIVLEGDRVEYVSDYEIRIDTNQVGIDGELIIATTPTLVWNENTQTTTGSILIEGYTDNSIEIIYDSNGTTYYVNGELYIPAE